MMQLIISIPEMQSIPGSNNIAHPPQPLQRLLSFSFTRIEK